MSIRLSEKHGVNPTMCQCFFCGEVKHIALMGRLKNDAEAPMSCIMDYEPCEKCQENMKMGVTLIEVSETQPRDNRPPLTAQGNQKVYPLGGWCVITPEASKRIFNMDMTAGQKLFVDSQVLQQLVGGNE